MTEDIPLMLLALAVALLSLLTMQVAKLRDELEVLDAHQREMKRALKEARDLAEWLKQQRDEWQRTHPEPQAPVDAAPRGQENAATTTPVQGVREADFPEARSQDTAEERAPIFTAAPSGNSFKNVAQQLYRQWCADDRPPVPPDPMEISYLRYAGDSRVSEMSPPLYVFSDDEQAGEFVRFSEIGTDEGLAFPNPQAFFNAGVHRILFPDITKDTHENHHQLAATPPVLIQRQADGTWQKVS